MPFPKATGGLGPRAEGEAIDLLPGHGIPRRSFGEKASEERRQGNLADAGHPRKGG